MNRQPFWSLNKLIVFVLIGGFAVLAVEIRSDHRDVLGEQPLSWTPIVYSVAMIVLGLVGLAFWSRGGRRALLFGFVLGMIVGPLGFWLHNRRDPVARVEKIAMAWELPVRHGREPEEEGRPQPPAREPEEEGGPEPPARAPREEQKQESGPPVLAPLSFFGLGLIGALACARGLQPRPAP